MIVRVRGVKRVRAKGRTYYYHRKTGKRLTAAPGTHAFVLEIAELDRLQRPAPERDKEPGSLGALITKYRSSPEYKQLADRTRADYEKVFDWLAPLDRLPLIQLDGPAIIELRDRTFRQKKRRFANHMLQALGTVLNWGRLRKLSFGYPLAGQKKMKIARPKEMPKANRPWSESERRIVLAEAVGGLKLGIALGMFAAMRGGDAVRVTWPIYDGTALEWRQGKTGDDVWVPADRELRNLLDAAPRAAVTIVTGALGRPLSEAGFRKAFRSLILRLEKEGRVESGLTFHGLRHTAGKTLADLRADPRMIQALLGHRSMAASLHYSEGADRRRAATAAVHLLEQGRTKIARAYGKPSGKPASWKR
jgi:integrase